MEKAIALIRLVSNDDPYYMDAMNLYAVSFPYHEQRESAPQASIMSDPAYHFDMIFDQDRFVGIILNWQTDSFVYVEHFCIMPDLRGRGYGKQTLELLATLGKTMILEIDPPVDAVSIRRKGFYESAGYVENPFAHIHPPYHRDHKGHELVVMSSPNALTESLYQEFNSYLCSAVMG